MQEDKKKIKICYIIPTLQYGGAEVRLVEVLNNIDCSKFNLYMICLASGPLESRINDDVKIMDLGLFDKGFPLHKKLLNYIRITRSMKALMKENRFDIVQCFVFKTTFLGSIAARLARVPVVIATRGQCALTDSKLAIFLRSFINPLADLIMCDSIAIKDSMLKWEFVPKRTKVRIVYNGKNPEMFDISVDEKKKRKEIGVPEGWEIVASVANLHWYKGYDYLIEAAAKVISKSPKTCFVIVGDGVERENLKRLAEKLGISKNILFLGHRKDVLEILKISDMFVLTSFSEGFSNAVLEAMGMALPQVITDVGGNKEAVIDGKTGFLVPPKESGMLASKILYLLKNPKTAKEMGKAGKERLAKYFTSRKMIKDMEDTYLGLLRCKK